MNEHTALHARDETRGPLKRLQRWCASLLTLENRLFWVTATWSLLTGVERAIIMPTLWLYFIRYFNHQAGVQYYGVTASAFNFSVLVFSPIYGYLAYWGVNYKLLIIVSNQLEVIGNTIYFLATRPWLVLVGRFVAGVGGGSEVPLYANIMRGLKSEIRSRMIITLLLFRQFGLIVGPGCSIMMHPMQFDVGTHHFDVYNLAGMFMAALWILHTAITVAIYPSVVPAQKSSKVNDKETNEDSVEEKKASVELMGDERGAKKASTTIRNTYLNAPTIALCVSVYGAYMSIMALEAVMPPVLVATFGWSDLQISCLYLACGGFVIIVFIFIRIVADRLEERQFLVISLIELCLTYAFLTIVTFLMTSTQPILYTTLILLGIVGHVFGIPFVVSFCEALFIQKIPDEDMDRAQSIFRSVFNVAILVGPFLGGSLQNWPWSAFLIIFAHMFLGFCLISSSYKAFEAKETKS